MNPTIEQSNILEYARISPGNLMIRAYAGTGKTSTLAMIDEAMPPGPHLLICFNKLVAEAARKRMRSTTKVATFNSIGHSIWASTCGRKINLEPKKIGTLFRDMIDNAHPSERTFLWSIYDQVTSAVEFARALGYVPPTHAMAKKSLASWTDVSRMLDEVPDPEVHAIVDKLLTLSIHLAFQGTIDFSDQVYMPALFGSDFPRFPLVMIDEYQDLSPVNQTLVSKLTKSSRQIGVGDEAQAIYGFRGADNNAMALAISTFNMVTLPLSISFRCPSEIVRNVHWRVPDFKAANSGGEVETLEGDHEISSGTVICRNNAPLIRLALRMLSTGHKVDVAGCDIGHRVIRQLSKLGDESLSRPQLLRRIAEWEDERLSLDSKTASDTADCMRLFATNADSLGGAIAYAKHLFAQAGGTVRFMTGHKSKGLEFEHVYHLDPHIISERGQDPNLRYVIDTRTSDLLSYINSEKI